MSWIGTTVRRSRANWKTSDPSTAYTRVETSGS